MWKFPRKNHGFVKGVFSIQGMGCFDHQNPKKLDQSPLEDLEGTPDGSGHSTSSQTSGASCHSQRTPGGRAERRLAEMFDGSCWDVSTEDVWDFLAEIPSVFIQNDVFLPQILAKNPKKAMLGDDLEANIFP